MANPTSRQTLIDYCKRRLGEPVIEVNVDEDQAEDRLDEALQIFREYHSESTFRFYVSHQVTADDEEIDAQEGDAISVIEDTPPSDTVLGVEIFPVIHTKSMQKIYVSLEDIK